MAASVSASRDMMIPPPLVPFLIPVDSWQKANVKYQQEENLDYKEPVQQLASHIVYQGREQQENEKLEDDFEDGGKNNLEV